MIKLIQEGFREENSQYKADMKKYLSSRKLFYKPLRLQLYKITDANFRNFTKENNIPNISMFQPPVSKYFMISDKPNTPITFKISIDADKNEDEGYITELIDKTVSDIERACVSFGTTVSEVDEISVDDRYADEYDVLSYSIRLWIDDVYSEEVPIEPTRLQKTTRQKEGPLNGVYTSIANKFYCDEDEIEDLFDIENAREVLRRSGWLKGSRVYIPKGTEFYLDGSDNYGDFIVVKGGPLDGVRIHFVDYGDNDPLSLQYYINRYTK